MGKKNKALKKKKLNTPTNVNQYIEYGKEFTVNDLISFCDKNDISLNTPIRIAGGTIELWCLYLEEIRMVNNKIILFSED